MKFPIQFAFLVLLSLAFAAVSSTIEPQRQTPEPSSDVERGKYLVEEIAKCTECHTPRDKNNQLERDRWLQGAPIWIQPVIKTNNWADNAPMLAGLSNYTDEQVQRVLEKGEGAGGAPIQPPMHIYHMKHSDAAAIIAYLRSLPRPLPNQR